MTKKIPNPPPPPKDRVLYKEPSWLEALTFGLYIKYHKKYE